MLNYNNVPKGSTVKRLMDKFVETRSVSDVKATMSLRQVRSTQMYVTMSLKLHPPLIRHRAQQIGAPNSLYSEFRWKMCISMLTKLNWLRHWGHLTMGGEGSSLIEHWRDNTKMLILLILPSMTRAISILTASPLGRIVVFGARKTLEWFTRSNFILNEFVVFGIVLSCLELKKLMWRACGLKKTPHVISRSSYFTFWRPELPRSCNLIPLDFLGFFEVAGLCE